MSITILKDVLISKGQVDRILKALSQLIHGGH